MNRDNTTLNPNNHVLSDEDLQIERDENIISLLDSLADKYMICKLTAILTKK